MIEIEKSKICAVITTFFPNDAVPPRVMRVLEQVGHVIIVDDTGDNSHEFVHDLIKSNVTYVKNKVNSGIARSLNIGVENAINLGYQWVLTLDDDTLISQSYVAELIDFLNSNECHADKVGVIALTRGSDQQIEHHHRYKRTLITSGGLSHIDAFTAVGGFNEGFFIDLVDFDYCTRLRKNGYEVIQLSNIGMQHKVGESVTKKLFGVPIIIYNHAPFRLYYQVRNTFFFFKDNVKFDPMLSCYLLLDVIRAPLKTVFFENQKFKRLGYIFRGLRDGLRGKSGKILNKE